MTLKTTYLTGEFDLSIETVGNDPNRILENIGAIIGMDFIKCELTDINGRKVELDVLNSQILINAIYDEREDELIYEHSEHKETTSTANEKVASGI